MYVLDLFNMAKLLRADGTIHSKKRHGIATLFVSTQVKRTNVNIFFRKLDSQFPNNPWLILILYQNHMTSGLHLKIKIIE